MTTVQEKRPAAAVNTVTLSGRISSAPALRELPSGDPLVTFRISVPREPEAGGGRKHSDWFDCAVWGGRTLRTSQGWGVGDTVEVRGQLRRRHYRVGGGTQTRVEVLVLGGRRVRRGPVV